MTDSRRRPPIYYVRHGETDWNAQARFQGRRDIPLNDKGRAQAGRNGRALVAELGAADGFDFLCSPLSRARDTMEIIRGGMGLDPADYAIDERLIEASYGDLEGVSLSGIEARHPDLFETRRTDRWHFTPPGGESLAMTLARVSPLIDGLAGPTVIVAHGAVGRAVRRHLLGLSENDAAWYEFPQDKVFRFEDGGERLI
ncbi:MAG: histidine phosphatase family protein [Nitratireductor sp.]|nr:histidine phosphatase family protein [Nitratireductor sp.]